MPGGTGQGYIQLSFDGGETWESKFLENNFWNTVGFGDHTIVMMAGNCQSARIQNTDTITQLSDISWTGNYRTGNPVPRDASQICFNNGVFYCTGSYRGAVSSYAYSTDGLNWNQVMFPKSMNPQGGGSALPTFGPNGEMYIADAVSNSLWVNPTPMDGTTWRELPGTSIDIYDFTATNGQTTIVIPKSRANYYHSEDTERYYAYEFPNGLEAGGLIVSNNTYYTILSNINRTETYIASSEDGLSWDLVEFVNAPSSTCVSILNYDANVLVFGFDNG
jgi:hypothetical protein